MTTYNVEELLEGAYAVEDFSEYRYRAVSGQYQNIGVGKLPASEKASITEVVGEPFVITAGPLFNQLWFSVDGGAQASVDLVAGSKTAAEFVTDNAANFTAIGLTVTAVTLPNGTPTIKIESNTAGGTSRVESVLPSPPQSSAYDDFRFKQNVHGSGTALTGIVQNNPPEGGAASVAVKGRCKALAGAVLAPGTLVKHDTDGKLIAAGSGEDSYGIYIGTEPSQVGEVVSIELNFRKG